MKLRFKLLAALFALALAAGHARAQHMPPVVEVAAPINDLAMVQCTQTGCVIYYNPVLVAQAGPYVAEFAKAHEYGHIFNRSANEAAADCYATQVLMRSNPAAVEAFIQLKASQGMGGGDATHMPGLMRARWVDECRRGMHRH